MNKLLLLIFAVALPFSTLAEIDDAKVIRSVWEMKSQSCNGLQVNNMSRDKNEKRIKASKEIVIASLGFSFKVPQLPEVKETIIRLNFNDRSRGVVDNYILISDQDLEPPFAAIVITELPANMKTRAEAFSAVKTLQNQLAGKSGFKVILSEIEGPFGRSLEMIAKNRVGSYCFPTSTIKFVPAGYDISTMGVSRFAFVSGKLIEFSIVVTLKELMSEEHSIAYARDVMDQFWRRLKVIRPAS